MNTLERDLVRYLDNLSEDGKEKVIYHLIMQDGHQNILLARQDIINQITEFAKMYPDMT